MTGKREAGIKVNCPCCGFRLFDIEPDREVGNEVIKIKCSRCKGVAAIKPKNYVPSK